MVCAQCGAESDEGQRFCYNCGARLDAQQTAPQPLPVAVSSTAPQAIPPPPNPIQPMSYQQPAGAFAPVVPNSNLAVISLVSGIVAWVLIPLLGAIVAVISGHMARSEIRRSGGTLAGEGLAMIGLVLGYAQLVLTVLAICAGLFFFIVAVSVA